MCGIGGIVGERDGGRLRAALAAMAGALAHRGPDDEGVEVIAAPGVMVGLCARRLAIQDISPAGHQPMTSPLAGRWICFNGEIYNVQEVREVLEARGHRFQGNSDTEVVLAAYGEWGDECLERLRGMFALAIWDAPRHQLFLARDRLGIKPIYYSEQGGTLLFASEVRALLATALVPAQLSRQGLASYLALGAVQEPLSLLDHVQTLPAGHYAVWKDHHLQLRPYWSLSAAFAREAPATDRATAAEQLRAMLEEAVRLHLISDVPLGVFLSGGIDSSALVGLVAHTAGRPPRTISVVFPQQRYSEEHYIRMVAERFHTEHAQVELDEAQILDQLPAALAAMDQPTFDGVNTYVVSRLARAAGLTVALSGVGADELFAGYDTFRIVSTLHKLRRFVPAVAAPAAAGLVRLAWGDTDRARKTARWVGRVDHGLTAYGLRRELFGPDARAGLCRIADDGLGTDEVAGPDWDAVNGTSYLELTHYMRDVLLHDTDVMSMAHGLEVRVPFLDHKLVEFCAGLPGKLKQERATPKPLLTEAVLDLLPDGARRRKKMGFTLPFSVWLRGPLRHEVESVLHDRHVGGQIAEAIDHDLIARVWGRFLDGKAEWVRPWSLYVLKMWGERHLPVGAAAIARGHAT